MFSSWKTRFFFSQISFLNSTKKHWVFCWMLEEPKEHSIAQFLLKLWDLKSLLKSWMPGKVQLLLLGGGKFNRQVFLKIKKNCVFLHTFVHLSQNFIPNNYLFFLSKSLGFEKREKIWKKKKKKKKKKKRKYKEMKIRISPSPFSVSVSLFFFFLFFFLIFFLFLFFNFIFFLFTFFFRVLSALSSLISHLPSFSFFFCFLFWAVRFPLLVSTVIFVVVVVVINYYFLLLLLLFVVFGK